MQWCLLSDTMETMGARGRDAYEKLWGRVEADLASYAQRIGCGTDRWRGRELGDDEAAGFLRALEAGVAGLERGGVCVIEGLGGGRVPKRYQLFSSYDGGLRDPGTVLVWSWAEMFTQIAFAAELILDHGWPRSAVQLEVGALDVAAGPTATVTTRPLLTAEAKVTDAGSKGLAAMMAVFTELSGTGPPAAVPLDIRTNAERKYRSLQHLRPAAFVEVAPGVRRAYDLEHCDDGTVAFAARPEVPGPAALGWIPEIGL